ncbi:MAG: TolC family protein, partial [Deltaproteobacteria bacterium]|nr:TolC family protein [Deltaproteobacteria bacterium]
MRKSIFYAAIVSILLVRSSNGLAQVQDQLNASPLTLEEAIQQTLAQNPELKAMQKDAEAIKAKVPQARSWDDPQIGVRLYQVPFNGGVGEASDIDYIVSQKIPFPGKKKAASEIVYHDYLHHLESLNANGRTLLREVKQTYYALFSVNRQIEQSKQVEKILKSLI